MITTKQRAFLRGEANGLEALYQIGKNGITDNLIDTLDAALSARELIKITVLETSPTSGKEACGALCGRLKAEPVQVIGRKIVIYRRSEENPQLVLPKEKLKK